MLESAGVDHVISEYDRHLSGDGDLRDFGKEAAEALGLSDDEVFKTLIVVIEGAPRSPEMVVAVLPVSCQLSMKLIAAAAGAKKATMCDPAAAERSSGVIWWSSNMATIVTIRSQRLAGVAAKKVARK